MSVARERRAAAAASCGIPADAIEDIHHVTPMQEGLWAASQRKRDAYNYKLVMEARGGVVGRLYAAWKRLVKITPMLRSCMVVTTLEAGRGRARAQPQQLLQVVVRNSYLESEKIVDDTLSDAAQNLAALGMAQLRIEPDPTTRPERTTQDSTMITLSLHHALFDGWALRLVLQELRTCFLGEPITPPPPFRRFVEYLEWDGTGEGREEARNFWHAMLLDSSPTEIVSCPAGHEAATDAVVSFVSEQPLLYPGPGRHHGSHPATTATATTITTATVVQTAMAMLLGAYAATEDVLFGVITSGRDTPVPGVLDMAGPTMAAIPCRVIMDRDIPVEKLLGKVALDSQAVLPYQHSGISRICRDYAGMTSVPQVLLVVQPSDVDVVGFSADPKQGRADETGGSGALECDWRVVSHVDRVHPYALVVECWIPRGRPVSESPRLRLLAHYDSCLLTKIQAGRLLEQLSHIIMILSSHLDGRNPSSDTVTRVGDVDMVNPSDIRLLQQLNATIPSPVERCLHELFADSLGGFPSATAVDGWDATFTYAALDELSSGLAERLKSRGVEAESRVLILCRKSAWVVVALLAVLKAGGAFVPLEPAHPDSRLRDIIRISGALVALAEPSLIPRLNSLVQSEYEVDVLDMTDTNLTEMLHVAHSTVCTRPRRVSPSNLAYVIFTSGTTGAPKGVEVQHRAVCSSITAQRSPDAMNMTRASRVLHFSPYCFDAMIDEIFMTLSTGACICIGREDELQDDLCGVINRYAITWAFLTPSVARTIDPKRLATTGTLQTLSLGGEAVLANDIKQWRGHVPQLRNGYGPTECCVICVVGDLLHEHDEPPLGGGYSYLGTPRGCISWVVDPKNPSRLSPVGAAGELLVEGPNLARGYLGNQDATSAKWIRLPEFPTRLEIESLASNPERRAYRTGDLVRMQPDGSLLYLGRVEGDSQAKLRGQRFELSEVESHVLSAQAQAQLGVREVAAFIFNKRRTGKQGQGQGQGQGQFSGAATSTAYNTRALALAFVQEEHENEAHNTSSPRVATMRTKPLDRAQVPQVVPLPAGLRNKCHLVCRALRATLPAYMIPTYWVPIDRMPLIPSMKTDRQRLAQLMQGFSVDELAVFSAEHNTSSEYKAATTPTEKKLAWLFGSVLDLDPEKISISEDFLSLGGDSITAMRLAASCRSEGIYGVTTAVILKRRTIEALAKDHGSGSFDASQHGSINGETGSSSGHPTIPPAFSLLEHLDVPKSEAIRAAVDTLGVAVSSIQDIYPATPLQKALFTLGNIHKDSYRGLFVFDIPPGIDLDLLQRAWVALKAATPIIRTRLFLFHSNIWQAVIQDDNTPCRIITSESLDEHLEYQRSISREMSFGSELFSAHIVVVDSNREPTRNHFVLNAHHTLYDGWSIRSITEEIERACSNNAHLSRKYCERNVYSQFVSHVVRMDLESSRDFWREYLSDTQSTFAKFPEVTGRANQQPQGALTNSTIDLRSNLPESSFTLSVVIYAAWSQLAAAYSSSEDVVFGVTSHGRDIPALPHSWNIVGPTIATFPLRLQVPSGPSEALVHDFVKTVEERANMIMAKGFEHYGLDEIGRAATSESSSFQSLVIVQAPREREPIKRRFGMARDVGANAHPYPLVLEATPLLDKGELHITAHYDSSLLAMETVQRLLGQFEHLIQETARLARPGTDAKLRDVNLLSPADASTIFQGWNASSALPLRVDNCVHNLIAARADKQPSDPAICGWDLSLSYAELERLASSLAAVLTREGVGAGQFVVICVERSAWTAVSQLSVLKAGGACILLDSRYPKARNDDIIVQSKAKLAIVSQATKGLFADSHTPLTTIVASEVLQLQSVPHMFSSSSDPSATTGDGLVSPSDPAYCVFTSGSTGSPKGIVIDHAALCTSASNYGPPLGLGPSSRVLHFASCTFDVHVGEILSTLIHGGCVCIPKEDDRMNDLPGCINSFRANWIYLTSSVAAMLKPEDPQVSSLKTLVVGGEAVQQQVIETWAESNVTLINAYGPAETTIYCSSRVVPTRDTDARDIGKAMGCRMCIVCPNDHRRLLPIGATGEIVVDGPILARGYLNQPDTTDARFITSVPFLPECHRAYCTGDLACYDAEGNFHFRGRSDTQIKVNGQRIDVAEVEAHIMRLKAPCNVQHAAVVSFKRRTPGHTGDVMTEFSQSVELAAFICFDDFKATSAVPTQGSSGPGQATAAILPLTEDISARLFRIKDHLKTVLPAYMLPAVYLPIDGLPSTTSMKLDRKALERAVESLSEAELRARSAQAPRSHLDAEGGLLAGNNNSSFGLPRDALESELGRIWKQVLGRGRTDSEGGDSIRTGENFFALGGNSLSAMQMVWLARSQRLEVSMSDLYNGPTISQLAQTIRTRAQAPAGEGSLPTPPLVEHFGSNPEPFSLVTSEEKAAVELEAKRCLGIPVDGIEDIYPATDTQVGLLLQTEQRAGLWIAYDQWELPMGLDIDKFRAAWNTVVERCPILRTRVLQIDSDPTYKSKAYQVVLRSSTEQCRQPEPSATLNGDESHSPAMGFGKRLSVHHILAGSCHGSSGPSLFRWTRHHAIYDEWSTQLILGLVADIYSGRTPRETRSFSCYVRTLQNLDQKAAREFWLSELTGVGAEAFQASRFPCSSTTGFSRSPVVSGPATQSQMRRKFKLCGLQDDRSSSMFGVTAVAMPTALEAAWAFVISAYTGSRDVLFGVVQSGRTSDIDPSILHAVGPTMAIVPRRVRLDDQLGLGAFLRAYQQRAQAAVPYEVAGLEVMRKVLAGGHSSLNNLLVIQAGLEGGVHHVEAASGNGLASLGLRLVTTGHASADAAAFPFGLVLECVMSRLNRGPKSGHLDLIAHYDECYIKKDTIDRLLSHFEHVINQLVRRRPDTVLGEVSIWGPGQIMSQLRPVHDNTPPAAMEACVHDLVARHWHVDSHLVDSPAVLMRTGDGDVSSHRTLTYRDLDKYSWIISSRLIQEAEMHLDDSLEPPFVAICMEKSHWTVAAMIGVWRAGAAVILLEPSLPRYLLRKAVQNVNAIFVLVSTATQHLWEDPSGSEMDGSDIKSVLMPFPPEEEGLPHAETAPRSSRPGDTCYCVFTSGSTGLPKGVAIQHRAICTSAVHHGSEAGLDHTSRVMQFASYSFDVAIDEIVTTLIHGGCVCVVGEEDRKSPADLAEAMREMDVNVALLTPAVLQTLDPGSVPACLKTLVVGGSSLSSSLLALWEKRVRLLVAYGPSECSVTATMNSDVSNSPPGTIGRPVGCRAWVLGPVSTSHDETASEHSNSRLLRLGPLGCVGELVVEGPILAKGYIGDPELTAKRFILASSVAGQFCQVTGCHPDARLYRTGDLVRQNPDGSLLFVGRMDSQVKVRGVRVEPEAIEHYILDKTGFPGAVVVCPEKGPFSGRLVAIVQPQDRGHDFASSLPLFASTTAPESQIVLVPDHFLKAVKTHIEERLPPSHVPKVWATVARMPLLYSGKVDRAVLRKQLENADTIPVPHDDPSHLGFSPLPRTPSPRDETQRALMSTTPLEARVRKLLGQVLGADLSSAPSTSTFTRLGGDSLLAMQLVSRARTAGVSGISVAKLLGDASIAELVQVAEAAAETQSQKSSSMTRPKPRLPRSSPPAAPEASEAVFDQYSIALTFAQRMFFIHYPFGPGYFNQSVSMTIRNHDPAFTLSVGRDDIRGYLLSLVERHDALRSRFWRRRTRRPDGIVAWHWESVITGDVAGSLRFRAHVLDDSGPVMAVDIAQVAMETHQSLNITSGPLFAADLFCLPHGSMELLLVAHHLVVDIVSWSILLGDLEALILGTELGPKPAPPALDSGVLSETKEVNQHVDRPGATSNEEAALEFWGVDTKASSVSLESLPDSRPVRFNLSIGQNASRLLSEAVASINQLEIGDVVEAVVAKVFADFCRDRGRKSPPLVYAEEHGRNFYDQGKENSSSASVGWLTRVCSVDVSLLTPQTSLLEAIWHARSGRRRSQGMGSGVATTSTTPVLPLELVINYTGRPLIRSGVSSTSSLGPLQPASTTTAAELATVPDADPCLTPLALIEVLAVLCDKEGMELTVTYDSRIQHVEMLRSCVESCVRVLRDEAIPNLAASASGWHSTLRLLPGLDDETAGYTTGQRRREQVRRKLGLRSIDEVETIRACSTAQTQILLAQAQAQARVPDSLAYHVRAVWEVSLSKTGHRGPRPTGDTQTHAHVLDLARLHNACETVVRHHPSLRTAFVQLPDMVNPVQVILRDACADTVLRTTLESRPGQALSAATVARLELDINHACFDGSSTAVLLRDIASAYAGEPLNPDSVSAAHRYFAHTEKAREQVQKADAFWAQHLQDAEPCRLPPLGAVSVAKKCGDAEPALGFFDECLRFEDGKASTSSWCRRFGATTAVAIHTAWAVALMAYCCTPTETHDICFGWIASGRDLPVQGLENVIGMFANVLVFRAQVGPNTLLRDAVAATARGLAEGLEHQIGKPNLCRHGEPLCDTLVSVQSVSASTDAPGHGQLCFRQTEGLDRVGYSLSLNVGLAKYNDDTIDCRITYDTVRVSETAARAFFAVFQRALSVIITTRADSAASIADIDLFPPLHHQLAHGFNNNNNNIEHEFATSRRCIQKGSAPDEHIFAPNAAATTVVSLFSEQVRARPSAVAVEAWDASFTFAQLDTLSTSLCQHLVDRLGLSRGHTVALLCEKSAWVVVAMLAVLRAGAACSMLSPADGLRRLRNMVAEQMRAHVIISSPVHEEKARGLLRDCDNHTSKIVVLDPDWDVFRRAPSPTSVLDRSRPDHVAFVLFTSGSTGKPKGIRLTHSSLCLSVLNYTRRLGVSDQTRLFQFSAYTFDVGIGDMVASLATGAVLCVPSEQDRLGDLNGAIDSFQASCVILTPSVAAFLRPERLKNGSLRTMVLIGEVATSELYRTWYGRVRLFNAYGPAECSVLSTVSEVGSPDDNPAIIGTAVAPHCRVWLVDPADPSRLVPIGSSGELLIEGQHVALGYLNDPDTTARAFISGDKAPAGIQPLLPGARLYLSGDLARLVPHQGLVFLGRKDLQIKLRGQRIEIGEIEFHVRRRALEGLSNLQQPAACASVVGVDSNHGISVMAAVVTARQASGEDALAAFVSLTPEDEDEKMLENDDDSRMGDEFFARIKSQLNLDLPPHMVPSVFLPIKRLPQTPSGKLDRKKLMQLAAESCSHSRPQPLSPRAAKDSDAAQTQTQTQTLTLTCGALESPTRGLARNTQQQHRSQAVDDDTLNPSQKWLRSLWAKVLKAEAASIGPDDDFFSLGGDSILAMRLAAASLEEGIRLPVLTIMRFPVLSRMAAELDRSRSRSASSGHDAGELRPSSTSRNENTQGLPGDAPAVDAVSGSDAQNEFPATSFQEAVLAFNMAPGRGFLNYFVAKLDSRVDTSRLEMACRCLLTQHPVLRSSFAYKGDSLLQRIRPLEAVNFRKLDISPGDGSERQNTIDDHVAGLIESDRNAPLEWGDCLTNVFIIRHQVTGASRLVLRLSHALYDGMCLSNLWNDLSSAYDGRQPEACTSRCQHEDYGFVQFASAVAADVPETSRQFWHTLLNGSDMTPVVVRQANGHQHDTGTLSQPPPPRLGLMQGRQVSTVSPRNLAVPSVTPASVLKAAWAVVLAANTLPARSDVVFGHVVSCRETLAPSMQDAVGAFVNCIPVRVCTTASAAGASDTCTDTGSAVRQLAEQVQAQHVAGLPHHAIGLGHLIRSGSVNWINARFSSVVQYQNLPASKFRGLSVIESGPLRGTGIEVDGRAGAYADVWVTATPLDAETTEVELRYDVSVVEDELARKLHQALCTVLRGVC